jgi:hypothetical protein
MRACARCCACLCTRLCVHVHAVGVPVHAFERACARLCAYLGTRMCVHVHAAARACARGCACLCTLLLVLCTRLCTRLRVPCFVTSVARFSRSPVHTHTLFLIVLRLSQSHTHYLGHFTRLQAWALARAATTGCWGRRLRAGRLAPEPRACSLRAHEHVCRANHVSYTHEHVCLSHTNMCARRPLACEFAAHKPCVYRMHTRHVCAFPQYICAQCAHGVRLLCACCVSAVRMLSTLATWEATQAPGVGPCPTKRTGLAQANKPHSSRGARLLGSGTISCAPTARVKDL